MALVEAYIYILYMAYRLSVIDCIDIFRKSGVSCLMILVRWIALQCAVQVMHTSHLQYVGLNSVISN